MQPVVPKGEPVLWLHRRQRAELQSVVGAEASNLLYLSRRYYYCGFLLMLGALVIFLATLGIKHRADPVLVAIFTAWLCGAMVTARGYVISKHGAVTASSYISGELGYAVRIEDVGPPANWQRRIARASAIHEGNDRER